MNTSKVTRVEVIDDKGRAYTNYSARNVTAQLQDDDHTLKIFLASAGGRALEERSHSDATEPLQHATAQPGRPTQTTEQGPGKEVDLLHWAHTLIINAKSNHAGWPKSSDEWILAYFKLQRDRDAALKGSEVKG